MGLVRTHILFSTTAIFMLPRSRCFVGVGLILAGALGSENVAVVQERKKNESGKI